MLKRGCEIISIAIVGRQFNDDGKHAESLERETLGHIDLSKNIHLTLFLCRLLHLVGRTDRDNVRVLAMIDVMPAKERYHRALRDENHIPASGETYKSYKSP